MITIPTDQALQRWDTLPMPLKEALYSEPSSDFLWKTCEAENVSDERIYDVARIAGYVLMGFLHPEDMGSELREQLGLDPKTSAAVASAVNQRVFAPLRQYIDKVYAPISTLTGPPKIISSVTGAVPPPKPPILAAPVPVFAGQPKAAPVPAPPPPPETPPPQAPRSGSPEPGWSKTAPPQKPAAAALGEFERLSKQGGGAPQGGVSAPRTPTPVPSSTPSPAPSTPAAKPPGPVAEPAPIIIHEDSSKPQQQKTPDFRLQLPVEGFGNRTGPPVPSVKPALLELGKASPPPAPPKPPGAVPNIVHYTEYKPSSSDTVSAPGAPKPTPSAPPQGPRQITEVTVPSASPQNKVVYKDYTEPPPQVSKARPPSPSPPPPPPPPPKS